MRAAFVLATVLALVVMAAFIRYALRTDLSAAVEAPDETVAAH
ncbi:hypothetical protein ACFSTC_56365 [Nonomuraea ferruginea]